MKIDIIIPIYKPDKRLFTLIERLSRQTVAVNQIILMNTEEKYFQQLTYGTSFFKRHRNVKVYHVSKREFDHGRTRHLGVRKSAAELFVMMTQDAMPADSRLLEELTGNLKGQTAVAYARQLPADNSSPIEKCSREFNYPGVSRIKSLADVETLGIKTFFCSNVCAAYRRDIYEESGGFIRHTIFNEDMIYAAGVIKAGYKVAYEAGAKVYHSHDYTLRQQFQRNFDMGVSQAKHPEIFRGVPSESEGRKLVKDIAGYLKANKMKRQLPWLYLQSGCKYAGYLLGKHYNRLPRKMVLGMTMNREYWLHEGRKRDAAGVDAARGYGKSERE